MQEARKGRITDEMKAVAENEGISVQQIIKGLANGRIVIPKNVNGRSRPMGVGKGLKTKINANLGSSPSLRRLNGKLKRQKQQLNTVQIP